MKPNKLLDDSAIALEAASGKTVELTKKWRDVSLSFDFSGIPNGLALESWVEIRPLFTENSGNFILDIKDLVAFKADSIIPNLEPEKIIQHNAKNLMELVKEADRLKAAGLAKDFYILIKLLEQNNPIHPEVASRLASMHLQIAATKADPVLIKANLTKSRDVLREALYHNNVAERKEKFPELVALELSVKEQFEKFGWAYFLGVPNYD